MLHFFNPGHEMAVLNSSPYYTPPVRQVKMRYDLAYLPAWYASENDFIWVEKDLPTDFLRCLEGEERSMPKAVSKQHIETYLSQLSHTKLALWGVSPSAVRFFEQIDQQYRLHLALPVWHEDYRKLCSRRTAKQCLEFLIAKMPQIRREIVPQYVSNIEDVENILKKNPGQYLVKSPFSSSGRGLLWLSGEEIDRPSRQLLSGMLKRQGNVSIEKALQKKEDFSLQFHANGDGKITFVGYSLFKTDVKGNYLSSLIASQQSIQEHIIQYISASSIETAKQFIMQYLTIHFAPVYVGHIGVDLMIYEENGTCVLHPCVEINARTTMGYLALRLQKRFFGEDGHAHFQIAYAATPGEILRRHQELQSRNPLVFANGKIRSGYLSLCPVDECTQYLSFVLK
ncbi:MAG: hypothetical protein LBM08_09605 [Dysgonamonadaceae bacterium]|jgi:hypothetical protein|nr:hypothetical protein [Dysgonamonadaceae bacterium]